MKQAFRLLSLTVTLLLLLVSLPTAPVVHADPLPPDAPSASGGRSIFLPLITRDGCNAQRQETRANGWRYIAVCSKAIVQRGPYNSQNGAYAIWWKTPRADQVYRLALIEQTAPPVALLATEPAAEPQQVAEGLILGTAAICVACIIVGIVLIGVTYWAITEYQQYAASQPAYTEQQIVSDSAITTATTIDDLEQMIAENLVPVDTSDTSADGIHMREGGQVRVQQRVDILRRYADAGRPSPSNC